MTAIKIATRRSRLAMAQASEVRDLLIAAHPGITVSLVEVTTSGDRDRTSSVTTLTEVGAFVRAVQEAVIHGDADLAVHSCKDLPIDGPHSLIPFYPRREEPWDVLCGHDVVSLPEGAVVGTGSPRRGAQLRLQRPDVEIRDIRGNVETRLHKMHSGDYDAIVLAEAGLRRLGLTNEIDHRFSIEEMVPAPAQAALAVEAREDGASIELIQDIDDPVVRKAVEAERALLSNTNAGCRSALGALATVDPHGVRLVGFVEDERGPRFGRAEAGDANTAARLLQKDLGL